MSIIAAVASTAGRVAHDMRSSVHRARIEGERRVLERRHRRALAALGARAHVLARDGDIPAGALAAEIAEVDARLADLAAAGGPDDADAPSHDAATAFPILADDD